LTDASILVSLLFRVDISHLQISQQRSPHQFQSQSSPLFFYLCHTVWTPCQGRVGRLLIVGPTCVGPIRLCHDDPNRDGRA
jgi:hypothetical protein